MIIKGCIRNDTSLFEYITIWKIYKKLYIKVTCCYSSNMTNSYLFYIQKGNMIIGELNAKWSKIFKKYNNITISELYNPIKDTTDNSICIWAD